MAESMQSLDQLSQLKPATPEAPKYVKKVDKYGRAYATGKRKDAVARVWIKPGAGKIMVNTREVEVYFARPVLRMMIQQPLVAAARNGQYDVICTVAGGGLSGQAGAVRHGLSKALTNFEPELRGVLKKGGFLTRNSRVPSSARSTAGRKRASRSSSRSANRVVKICRESGIHERKQRAPSGALFVWNFSEELQFFFPKTCAVARTDFERGSS